MSLDPSTKKISNGPALPSSEITLQEIAEKLPRRIGALRGTLESLRSALSDNDPAPHFGIEAIGEGARLGELIFETEFFLNQLGLGADAVQLDEIRQCLHKKVFVEQSNTRIPTLSAAIEYLDKISAQLPAP